MRDITPLQRHPDQSGDQLLNTQVKALELTHMKIHLRKFLVRVGSAWDQHLDEEWKEKKAVNKSSRPEW